MISRETIWKSYPSIRQPRNPECKSIAKGQRSHSDEMWFPGQMQIKVWVFALESQVSRGHPTEGKLRCTNRNRERNIQFEFVEFHQRYTTYQIKILCLFVSLGKSKMRHFGRRKYRVDGNHQRSIQLGRNESISKSGKWMNFLAISWELLGYFLGTG